MFNCSPLNKRKRISIRDNQKWTLSREHRTKTNKTKTTKYVLDTTMHKQTQKCK